MGQHARLQLQAFNLFFTTLCSKQLPNSQATNPKLFDAENWAVKLKLPTTSEDITSTDKLEVVFRWRFFLWSFLLFSRLFPAMGKPVAGVDGAWQCPGFGVPRANVCWRDEKKVHLFPQDFSDVKKYHPEKKHVLTIHTKVEFLCHAYRRFGGWAQLQVVVGILNFKKEWTLLPEADLAPEKDGEDRIL